MKKERTLGILLMGLLIFTLAAPLYQQEKGFGLSEEEKYWDLVWDETVEIPHKKGTDLFYPPKPGTNGSDTKDVQFKFPNLGQ